MTDAPPNPRLLSQVPFRALIEHASDILTLIDAGRRIRYTSLSTRRILGYDPDAMLDQDVALFVHPHERATIIERLESVQATPGAVSTAEYRVQHADGSWRWIEGTATNLLDAPEVQAIVLNSHDVTVHREAERVLEHRVSQRTSELAALYRADAALYRSLQVEDVLKALVDQAAEITGADKAMAMVWDEARERLVPGATRGFSPETVARMSYGPGESIAYEAARTAQPIAVEDVASDSRTARHITEPENIRSLLHVPITVGGQVFGMFGVLYTRTHRFSAQEERLLQALAQRAALAIENARLYQQAQGKAALEERQKLARELHDSVAQALYGITLGAKTARGWLERDPSRVAERLDYVINLAQAGQAEMRALIFELRPESLAQEGLATALRKQAASIEARHGPRVALTIQDEPDVSFATKEALYRIAQEALHNVTKHARATQVELRLERRLDGWCLQVCDDGAGFDPLQAFPGHLGLRSMRERAEHVGGRLDIQSAPGQGTRLRASVPV